MLTQASMLFMLAYVIPFLLNAFFTPLILYLSHRFNWFDQLDKRKIHTGEVPRLGGVGFFLSFTLVSIGFFVFVGISPSKYPVLLFTGIGLIHILGLVDDFRNIPARFKLLGQLVAGVLVVLGGVRIPGITVFGLDLSFGYLSIPLTVFWLISLSNSMNLIDGVDGLAGGVSFISSLAFAYIHWVQGSVQGVVLSLILAGSVGAFLLFNKPKAKIFMGDSGSLFLGFMLGSLFFLGNSFDADFSFGGISVTMTILVVPILDLFGAIIRRVRKGLPIFSPDREHLHHKLLDFGFTVPKILTIVYLWTLIASIGSGVWISLLLSNHPQSPWIDLILLALWILSVGLFSIIHYKNKALKHFR
jgi:UDP-GlcNAc:undecaprenyl-phosphate GlcNAc-1-phosphate transferase